MIDSVPVTKDNLMTEVKKLLDMQARFVIASCLDFGDKLEILYHFDVNLKLINLRLQFGYDETIPSISSVYPAAALIEMEMTDLFGTKIEGISGGFLLTDDSPKLPMRKAKKESA
jgi:ech hydrogenase subunit D